MGLVTCRCADPYATVEESLKCELHLKGHTILGCQVCGSAVCRLFFSGTNSSSSKQPGQPDQLPAG